MSYRIINGQTYSIGNIGQVEYNSQPNEIVNKNTNDISFKNVLNSINKVNENFKISKHAVLRLNKINFNDEDFKNIEKGFQIAKEKNSKNTVMLYKDVALIASVENKTIITVVEKERAKDNIFTNVDSVVIL